MGIIQHTFNYNTNSANTLAQAYTVPVTAGSTLLVYLTIGGNAGNTSTMRDSVNGTTGWQKDISLFSGATGNLVEIWSRQNSAAGTLAVTASWTGLNGFNGIFITEASALLTTGVYVDTTGSDDTGTNSTGRSISLTTSTANAFIFGGGSYFNGNAFTATAPTTKIDQDGGNEAVDFSRTTTSAGVYTTGGTWSSDMITMVAVAYMVTSSLVSQTFFSQYWPHPKTTNKTAYGQLWPR